MEKSEQPHQPAIGVAPTAVQIPMVVGAPAVVGSIPSLAAGPSPFQFAENQPSYQQVQHLHYQQQQLLEAFWASQMHEIEQTVEFKNHSLPLARIKKIMKADEDVRMISAEAPVIFAKACEMFILEITLRSWMHTEENKRRTLQKNDIAAAITRTDIFDFLVDIVPRDELKEDGLGIPKAADSVPYYYVNVNPQPPVDQNAAGPPAMAFVWQQPVQQQQQMADG
ncbi:Nuclear transcription factor Y subunit C-2 [Apostasia shenzhenica]|uniref:Nuclear transcription factor Y subunit C-2 n=1 Tax=Apostasia shenzhenica TaxID=1088818 RepID=A0A2I0B8H5_9ASPA|nr:Nuclear transcription factor Y subunit C-2 [Apostasia shenzhenica]